MSFIYTEDQLKVIELRDRNILVSAAAGSGKTTVLVERIIRRICDEKNPVDIDRLLVLTFTNAAAAEMRERISNAIDGKLSIEPSNEHLQRQATLIHNALITTIHSFCLFLLRNHFNEIGLDPGFRVADDGELKLLKEEVLTDVLEELFDAYDNNDFIHLADRFITGNSMKGLKDLILEVYKYSLSYPFAEEWLVKRRNDYHITDEEQLINTPWGAMLLAMAKKNIEESFSLTDTCLKLTQETDGPYMYENALESDIQMLTEAKKCTTVKEYREFFEQLSFAKLSPKKDETVDPQKKETVKNLRDIVKKLFSEMKKKYFSYSPELLFASMKENAAITDSLVDTVLIFTERFNSKKREKKLIDFSDMEHLALSILLEQKNGEYVPTQVAKDYRDYFVEIMIDEYQDSNLVQEWILKSISGEENGNFNRFMVGDVKQSIYKFRLACPALFMEKYDSYEKKAAKKQRIDLKKNYRSRQEIITSVNCVFKKLMSRDLGGVTYDEESALYLGASYSDNASDHKTELLLIEKDTESKKTKQEQEAFVIASKMKELVGSYEVQDKATGDSRKAKYSDMVILLRSNAGWDESFKRILEEEGIPSYITSKTGYFSANEIRIVMNFLKTLDNPKQDIPLYGTMISTFGHFTEDEIAILRLLSGEELYTCVKKCATGQFDEETIKKNAAIEYPVEKCRSFLAFLERYRRMVPYEPIHILLRKLFLETGYLYEVSAYPTGEQKRANVMMLLNKAENYEQSSYKGLFHFIHYMEQLQKYEVDFGEAATLDENADVVRIMSIHKSKGLEFPICFVAGLSKKFNMSDTRDAVIFDSDYGLGMDYVNLEKRAKYSDLRKRVLAEKMKQDNLAEEIRVLYVALTRAKEKLFLSAVIDDFLKLDTILASHKLILQGKEDEPLPLCLRLQASTYLDFILDATLNQNDNMRIIRVLQQDIVKGQITQGITQYERRGELLNIVKDIETNTENSYIDGMKKMKTALGHSYSHENLAKLYTKTTVSELKMAAIHDGLLKDSKEEQAATFFPENEKKTAIPRFVGKNVKVSGTARGSAYHRIMELHDFTKPVSAADLEEQVRTQVADGRITAEEAALVDYNKIEDFLRTNLANRMCYAQKEDKLYLEQPFVLGVSAERLSKDFPDTETVLIQGIIDVYFIEENEIVLMDYKTDAVKEERELIERYRTQLVYYTEALERITGLRVKEKLIYSFALEKIITVR